MLFHLDLVVVNFLLRSFDFRVHSTWHAFQKILSEGGMRGLWKGSIPNMQRAALVNLGDLTTYDTAKHLIISHTSLTDSTLTHILARFVSFLYKSQS